MDALPSVPTGPKKEMIMRRCLSVLVVLAALTATAAVAIAAWSPRTGPYEGVSHFNHQVHFTVDPAHKLVKDFRLGSIHIFDSAELHKDSSGQWRFSHNDQHFRATGVWTDASEVLGVVNRTSRPRTDPSNTYSAAVMMTKSAAAPRSGRYRGSSPESHDRVTFTVDPEHKHVNNFWLGEAHLFDTTLIKHHRDGTWHFSVNAEGASVNWHIQGAWSANGEVHGHVVKASKSHPANKHVYAFSATRH